jgi:hypothetical protein
MENQLILVLAVALIALALLFANNYSTLVRVRAENRRLRMVNEFLFTITSKHGPNLSLLVKMDLAVLQGLESRLISYYHKKFFTLITKSIIEEIEPYLESINKLPDSPQKDFIKKTLKKVIFSNQETNLKDLIFRTIKLSNTKSSCHGLVLKEFLFNDVSYFKEKSSYLIIILTQCKQLFEKIDVEDSVKDLMINDFNELISKINQ